MSAPLAPVITNAGLAAVVNAQGTGVQAQITQVAIGRGTLQGGVYRGLAPSAAATGLVGEMTRIPILSGSRLDPHGFRVLAVLPASAGEYFINEVGFVLATGEFLAIWSDPAFPLAYKSTLADVELAFDLFLEALPVASLAITVEQPDIPDTIGVLAALVAAQALALSQVLKMDARLVARGIA